MADGATPQGEPPHQIPRPGITVVRALSSISPQPVRPLPGFQAAEQKRVELHSPQVLMDGSFHTNSLWIPRHVSDFFFFFLHKTPHSQTVLGPGIISRFLTVWLS